MATRGTHEQTGASGGSRGRREAVGLTLMMKSLGTKRLRLLRMATGEMAGIKIVGNDGLRLVLSGLTQTR